MTNRNIHPPKKKAPGRPDQPDPGKTAVERQPPAGAERTEPVPSSSQETEQTPVPPAEPVTNQDEQEKITNADDRGTPAAEN